MDHRIKSDCLLLLTAVIWGFGFVAQRVGVDHVGPFTFNGLRFALGVAVLLPVILFSGRAGGGRPRTAEPSGAGTLMLGGITAGILLFAGASLQQVGLVYTTAGKAGFITGLYVVIVPILGLCVRHETGAGIWTGAVLATAGLYLLSVTESFTIAFGDFLELLGAVMWAIHVLVIGRLSPIVDSARLALIQFAACAVLSLITAGLCEQITLAGIRAAAVPIVYGGAISVGVAYTLQIVAQKNAHPAHAAILLSLESVVAALGGWLVLGEVLSFRGICGCALMLSGMLVSQLYGLRSSRINRRLKDAEAQPALAVAARQDEA